MSEHHNQKRVKVPRSKESVIVTSSWLKKFSINRNQRMPESGMGEAKAESRPKTKLEILAENLTIKAIETPADISKGNLLRFSVLDHMNSLDAAREGEELRALLYLEHSMFMLTLVRDQQLATEFLATMELLKHYNIEPKVEGNSTSSSPASDLLIEREVDRA